MSSYIMFTEINDITSAYDDEAAESPVTMSLEKDTTTHPELVTITDIMNESGASSSYSPDIVIVLSAIVGIIISLTVIGNLLVIVSFVTTPKLRTYNNYFILGLAIADLLVGAVDMPLFAVIIILGRWPLGEVFCDIFTFLDHAFSHVSILLVTLISFDRCIAVTYPLRHRQRWRRRSRAILIITISYIIPVIIWLPPTALWQVIHGLHRRPIPKDVCEPLYIDSVVASIIIPIVYSFIPFTITAILCARIYVVIKNFYKGRKKMELGVNTRSIIAGEAASDNETRDMKTSLSSSTKSDPIDVGNEVDFENEEDEMKAENSKEKHTYVSRDNKKTEIGRDSMKGVRTLVFIVSAMWIAWFPSVLVVITSSICSTCLPGVIYSVVIFWGYTNSLMNPICYALADKAFRDSFIRILSLRCLKDNNLSLGASDI